MIPELKTLAFLLFFFSQCHVTFPYGDILFFFGHFHLKFRQFECSSSFVYFVQKIVVFCVSDSFVQKTTQQSNGSFNVICDSQLLRKVFKKQSFNFCHYVQKLYCEQRVLHYQPWWRSVLFTQLQISHLLLGNVEEMLKKPDSISFTYQQVHCLYALFKYQFSENIESCHVLDTVQRAVCFNQRSRAVDRMASRRASWGKRTEKFFELPPKDKKNANQWVSFCRKNWTTSRDKIWTGIKKF